jgi:DNA modification methylase
MDTTAIGLEPDRVHLGDCLHLLPMIPEESVDMILCDLPYGTTRCKWDTLIPFDLLWEQYKRVIKLNGAIVLTGTEPFSSFLRVSCIDLYRYDWYWQKDKGANFLFGNKQPLKVIETVSVFYKAQPTYNPQKEMNPKGPSKRHLSPNPGKITDNVRDVMGSSWKETEMDASQNYHGAAYEPDKLLPKQLVYFAREQKGKVHPTQKPVALFEYLILTYTNEGETVLDNCAGSGTTGVACLKTRRHFILIERDPNYCDLAAARIRETTPSI